MLPAHDLNIGAIAEGVEATNRVEQIRSPGCEQGQEYLFSKPVDGDSARDLLENIKTAYA